MDLFRESFFVIWTCGRIEIRERRRRKIREGYFFYLFIVIENVKLGYKLFNYINEGEKGNKTNKLGDKMHLNVINENPSLFKELIICSLSICPKLNTRPQRQLSHQ